jgi:hypothetical protein
MKKYSLHLFLLLMLATPLLLPLHTTEAFPGGDEDDCEDEAMDCVHIEGMSAIEARATSATIQQFPAPPVRQIGIQEDILYARRYRKLNPEAVIYNAPGGTPIDSVQSGFTVVNVGLVRNDGWVQIGTDRWVKGEDANEFTVSDFRGYEILEPLERPIAWVVEEWIRVPDSRGRVRVHPSDYPGGLPNTDVPYIPRHSLVTIYATAIVDGYEWYLIGPNQWLHQHNIAKVKSTDRPAEIGENDRWVAVDLYEQTAVAYEGDRMVFATLTSSGRDGYSTRQGLFQIYQRHTSVRMTDGGGDYYIQNVPWTMFFDGDIALHGSYWHNLFGYRRSAGCVNLSIMDGHWFYQWTDTVPEGAAYIYVYSSGAYGARPHPTY